MSFKSAREGLQQELQAIRDAGLWKTERVIASDQKNDITLADGQEVINMCANNYLGLANNPEVIQAARDSYDQWGFGLSSVRFICGTQTVHKQLEEKVSEFLGMEDTILYAACFDANGGVFEPLLGEDAAIQRKVREARAEIERAERQRAIERALFDAGGVGRRSDGPGRGGRASAAASSTARWRRSPST